jgi:prolyl-tRNA editing enzyme YbaK/EbsC (Cys-tRNA(Pro) deacylase)
MRLQKYIDENGLEAKILEFDTPTLTVEQSVKVLKCHPEDIIKSIVVVTSTNDYYLILLQGNRKIKTKKLKKLLYAKDIRLASPQQVEKITNYKVGDVPPISVELPIIIDELVIERGRKLYGGGGGPSKLLHISIDELLDCTHPLIADVSNPI